MGLVTRRAIPVAMAGQIVCEMVKRRTRAGDAWYVGVAGSGGEQTRISMFFLESRTNDAGEVVEVWELRAEPLYAPPSRFERAPPPSRRVGAKRDGERPVSGP